MIEESERLVNRSIEKREGERNKEVEEAKIEDEMSNPDGNESRFNHNGNGCTTSRK